MKEHILTCVNFFLQFHDARVISYLSPVGFGDRQKYLLENVSCNKNVLQLIGRQRMLSVSELEFLIN